MLGVTLPPRSSPFLYTRALEWLEQQQSEGVAGGTGIEVTASGFSLSVLLCGARNGAHLGPEPPVIQNCCCVSKESRCQGSWGLFWHCHDDNSSSWASCFHHLFAGGSARQLIRSKLKFSMPVVFFGFQKGQGTAGGQMWVAGGKGYPQEAKPLGWLVIRSAGFQQRNRCSVP